MENFRPFIGSIASLRFASILLILSFKIIHSRGYFGAGGAAAAYPPHSCCIYPCPEMPVCSPSLSILSDSISSPQANAKPDRGCAITGFIIHIIWSIARLLYGHVLIVPSTAWNLPTIMLPGCFFNILVTQ